MTKIYIAFYDLEESGSRENWNTFYTPWVAATTAEKAMQLAQDAIKANVYSEHDLKITDDLDSADIDDEDREEIEYDLGSYHIEIQEGELL